MNCAAANCEKLMSTTIEKLLEEVKELLKKYNETLKIFLHKRIETLTELDQERLNHLLHELRSRLIHLEEKKRRELEDKTENDNHFFNLHCEAVHVANEHRHNLHRFLEWYFEELDELIEIHNRIQQLLNDLAREQGKKFDMQKNEHIAPTPHPVHQSKQSDEKES